MFARRAWVERVVFIPVLLTFAALMEPAILLAAQSADSAGQPTPATTSAPATGILSKLAFPALPASVAIGRNLQLVVEAPGDADLEYCWQDKPPDSNWRGTGEWQSVASWEFAPTKPGIWAVQVDVRDRTSGKMLTKKWLGEIRVTNPEVQAKDGTWFVLPLLPEQMKLGDVICPMIYPLVSGDYEYQWILKIGSDDWDFSAPWTREPFRLFKPTEIALHYLHVNVRSATDGKVILQRWLGTVRVVGPLVSEIYCSPDATALPVGTPIEFFVRGATGSLSKMEFRLWDLLPVERVVRDWQPWPLPAFVCTEAKRTALQIDVRLKQQPQVIDRHWLNSYRFFEPGQTVPGHSLMRMLIGDDFEINGFPQEIKSLARELYLCLFFLKWEAQSLSAAECDRRLAALRFIEKIEVQGGDRVLTLDSGRVYTWQPKSRLFNQTKSPLFIRVSLDAFPRYRELFELLQDIPEDAKLAVLLSYAVYEGYQYGTPPALGLMGVGEMVSHCSSQAQQAQRILGACGIVSDLVLIAGEGRHAGAAHMILKVPSSNDKSMLLDPTNGFIYEVSADWDDATKVAKPIKLPQCRVLDYLNLLIICEDGCVTVVAPERAPNTVP